MRDKDGGYGCESACRCPQHAQAFDFEAMCASREFGFEIQLKQKKE
jgi:hypothetical protein